MTLQPTSLDLSYAPYTFGAVLPGHPKGKKGSAAYAAYVEGEVALDLGCDRTKTPSSFGLDKVLIHGSVDVVGDIEGSLPFHDSSVGVIYLYDVLEHVCDVFVVMKEVHRVLRPGGRALISLPHYSHTRTYGDPTHRHFFSLRTIEYLSGTVYNHYSGVHFRVTQASLGQPSRSVLRRLVHLYPYQAERLLSATIGIRSMHFELVAVK